MNFPQIDQQQALRQLALLGHSHNNSVYLRFFYPSDDPRKDGDKGRKSNRLNFKEIETYQRQGRGAYFVINGGGHKNDDVTQGHAIFVEHDDLDKDLQRDLWQVLDLPEPTFQVDTGGKSIHSYWVFDEAVEINQWCQLQRDLLEYTQGDRSIKNPARVMRLAGAWHISHDQQGNPVYNQSKIIAASGAVYSFEELRGIIPEQENERLPLISHQLFFDNQFASDTSNNENSHSSSSSTSYQQEPALVTDDCSLVTVRHPDEIQVPVQASVPLLSCCRKEVREWVGTGVQKGNGRNDTAINVALELIAVERYLQSIGQSFSDSARSLFSEFCGRSSMTPSEDEMRWKWCEAKNPTPSCGDDGIEACIRGWYWRNAPRQKAKSKSGETPRRLTAQGNAHQDRQKEEVNGSKTSQQPSNNQSSSEYGQAAETLMMERIDEILLNQKLTEAQQDLELNKLAKLFDNFNAKEIREIASKRLSEFEREDNITERQQELEQLESIDSQEYQPFRDIFYDSPEVVEAFEHLCRVNKKIQPQFFLTILSIFSSIVGIKGSLFIKNFGKFRATLNVAAVGESGEGKSIVSGILLDPLYQLQKERLNAHKLETQRFNEAVELWEKQHRDERGPKPRVDDYVEASDAFMVINEYSREGIVKNHADNPNGLLIHQEELVAIQRAQNMYRQGKGDDRQFLNNLYDNKAIARSLKSERIIVEETAVSITGGYQPDVILGEMGDLSDPDGQWARFNFCVGTEKHVLTNLEQPWVDVFPLLYDLYNKALNAPEIQCELDKQGRGLLQAFINEMEETRWHTLQPGWRAVLSKASAEVCRIALGLHWMNCLVNGREVTNIVPAIAIKKAIKIKRYFLSQMQMIRTWGNADPAREDSLAPVYRQVMKIGKRVQGKAKYLTVRMVQSTRSGVFRNMKAPDINKVFKDLADMGKAKLVTHKRSLALVIDSMFGDGGDGEPPKSPPPSDGNAVANFSRPASVTDLLNTEETSAVRSSLLETVGGLFSNVQHIKPSYHQSFNSFVGTVGIVAGVFSPLNNLPLTSPTVATSAAMGQPWLNQGFQQFSTPVQQFQQTSSPVISHQSPVTSEQFIVNDDVTKLIHLLTQWESTNDPNFATQDELLAYAKEFEPTINDYFHQLEEACPNFGERWWNAISRIIELIPEESPPTLEKLKAQFLACTTWVQLRKLQKQHSEQAKKAYKALKPEERIKIDGVAATAIPHDVYRYTGTKQEYQGQILEPGSLVYIDPNAKKSRRFVSVWLLQGLEQGWKQRISVSRDCLEFVEKTMNGAIDVIDGNQGHLLDGLS